MRGQRHAPAALYPGKDPVPIVQEAGWAPRPVWTGAENLAPTRILSPVRPARSQSLYRLRYPAHNKLRNWYLNFYCTEKHFIFLLSSTVWEPNLKIDTILQYGHTFSLHKSGSRRRTTSGIVLHIPLPSRKRAYHRYTIAQLMAALP